MTDLHLMPESRFNGFLEVTGYRLLCVTLLTSFFLKPTILTQQACSFCGVKGGGWSFAPVKVGVSCRGLPMSCRVVQVNTLASSLHGLLDCVVGLILTATGWGWNVSKRPMQMVSLEIVTRYS